MLAAVLAGCAILEREPPREPAPPRPLVTPGRGEKEAPPGAAAAQAALLRPVRWSELPGWPADDPSAAWDAFLASCSAVGKQPPWRDVCTVARAIPRPDRASARRFFEENFTPFRVVGADGSDVGLVTGYYEPLLRGSRRPHGRYRYPLYGVPDDLLVIDLVRVYPELAGMRLRGRLEGRRVVPYYDRAQIEAGEAPLAGKELVWVDDPIELFFLHVQGSGRIALDTGETIRVGYAEQNGHPYRSIGRLLVERGELSPENASMQGIKAWARANPERLRELLDANASYVFFRELPPGLPGPLGALGVPLSAGRSLAVDPRFVPLGAPVYVATTWPASARPLERLMLAQDTGGAIRGPLRADFYWGSGEPAERAAGRMSGPLRMWVILPNGARVPQPRTP